MNLKPIHYFLGGVALTALIAAAKFVGGTPLDQTFTYQGQLRNAGQLVNGPVDLKISMWDADTGGSQVGSTNTFNAMQLNDGRFACGLNFGNAAFDGSNRWIQVEFRNPAGSGQYQALSPRDKITATPYALYALNGANGVWVYDTNQQSVSVMGKKVGIGTSNPTAALEVVSATGGDDSVKLPAGSIGMSELASPGLVTTYGSYFSNGSTSDTRTFSTGGGAALLLQGRGKNSIGNQYITYQILIDDVVVWSQDIPPNVSFDVGVVYSLPGGAHSLTTRALGGSGVGTTPWAVGCGLTISVFQDVLRLQ
jgi:hypothetical protein